MGVADVEGQPQLDAMLSKRHDLISVFRDYYCYNVVIQDAWSKTPEFLSLHLYMDILTFSFTVMTGHLEVMVGCCSASKGNLYNVIPHWSIFMIALY